MSELRVPTVTVDVDVIYADGDELSGRIFLPALASRHEGPMRADEWINDRIPFFPLLQEGTDRASLLNKDRVLVMHVPGMQPMNPEASDIPTSQVRVHIAGRAFEGMFHIDLPETKSRAQDYLNQSERFVALYDAQGCRLIRRIFIDRVEEIREV